MKGDGAMNILHVGPSRIELPAKRGGAVERRMVALAKAEARICFGRVVIFGPRIDNAQEESADGVVFLRSGGGKSRLAKLYFLFGLARAVWKIRPDVVVVHNALELPLFLRLAGYRGVISIIRDNYLQPASKVPLVSLLSYWLGFFSLRCADSIKFVSQYCQSVNSRYWSLPAGRTSVLYNGVDLEWFTFLESGRKSVRGSFGIRDDEIVVGFVGRVCRQKGTHVLLDAYHLVKALHPKIRLLVVGPGGQFDVNEPNDLVRAIASGGGIYAGAVPEEDLPAVFSAIDVFVMPTIELEMFGMAAVEAKACGCIVIASDHGGLPEVLDGTDSIFFCAGDSAELSKRLEVICDDFTRDLDFRLGSKQPDCLRRFSWDSLAAETIAAYRKQIGV